MVPASNRRVNSQFRCKEDLIMGRTVIGKQIALRRERLGLTKSAFGRETQLHVSTISQIENGQLIPYPSQMEKIITAFDRLEESDRADGN